MLYISVSAGSVGWIWHFLGVDGQPLWTDGGEYGSKVRAFSAGKSRRESFARQQSAVDCYEELI